jgi:RNA polymerase sigma factor (sigma-70 family)
MSMTMAASLLSTQSDARLAQLAAEGHDRAFEALVERYRAPLGRYLRRLLAPAMAEDVLQSSFIRAWQALRGGAEVRDVRAWLYRIAHNQAVNALRAGAEPTLPEPAPAPGADDELQRREELRSTLHEIRALPERQRTALLAVAVADRPHTDVARELGLSDGGLRQLLLRARTTLRAAATALTPPPLAGWLAAGQDSPTARIAEMAAGAGGLGVAAKVGTAVLATGVIVGGTTAVRHDAGGARTTTAASPLPAAQARPGRVAAAAASLARPSAGSAVRTRSVADAVARVPATRRRSSSSFASRTVASPRIPSAAPRQETAAAPRVHEPVAAPEHGAEAQDDTAAPKPKKDAASATPQSASSQGAASRSATGSAHANGPARTTPTKTKVKAKPKGMVPVGSSTTPSQPPGQAKAPGSSAAPKRVEESGAKNSGSARDAQADPVSHP